MRLMHVCHPRSRFNSELYAHAFPPSASQTHPITLVCHSGWENWGTKRGVYFLPTQSCCPSIIPFSLADASRNFPRKPLRPLNCNPSLLMSFLQKLCAAGQPCQSDAIGLISIKTATYSKCSIAVRNDHIRRWHFNTRNIADITSQLPKTDCAVRKH
jgi:hypothetical protein